VYTEQAAFRISETTFIKSKCIYFRQHNFCIDTLHVYYLLHVSAFLPASGMHIGYWLHCSLLILANVYLGHILLLSVFPHFRSQPKRIPHPKQTTQQRKTRRQPASRHNRYTQAICEKPHLRLQIAKIRNLK
jgi:hypothetical protein